jgi:hypothetical protein
MVRGGVHLHFECMEALHLLFEPSNLLRQPRHLGRACQRWLLSIGAVELMQVTSHAFLDLSQAPLLLGTRKVLVAVVHRFELAAVDCDAGLLRKQTHGAAQRNK